MENAGFPASNVDDYEVQDTCLSNSFGGTAFNVGQNGSVKGFVKELTYNATANGLLGIGCFTRTVYTSSLGGSGSTSLPYNDAAFIAGGFMYAGGWNSTTKAPTSANSGKVIGGYTAATDFSSSLTNNDTFARDGNYGVEGHPFYYWVGSDSKKKCILNYSSPIKFISINHPEIRGVYIQQMEKAPYFIGICKPANPPSWLNENNFPYGFMTIDSSFFTYKGFWGASNPLNTSASSNIVISSAGMGVWYMYTNYNNAQQGMGFSNANTKVTGAVNIGNSSKRDIVTAPHMFNTGSNSGASGKWLYGQFSNEVAVTLTEGLQLFDKIIISPGTEEYMVITTPNYQGFGDSSNPVTSQANSDSLYFGYYSMALRTV
jgi:hypothetical protein